MKTEFSKAEQDCRMVSLKSNRERKANAARAETKRFVFSKASCRRFNLHKREQFRENPWTLENGINRGVTEKFKN